MLKFKLDEKSFTSLSEDQQALYKQDGDSYFLQVDGAVDKSKLDEFRSTNVELMKEKEKFKDIDLEKYQSLIEQEQKLRDKELIDKGDIETLLEQRTAAIQSDYEAKLQNLTTQLSDVSSNNEKVISKYEIEGAALKAFGTHKISPDAQEAVLSQIRSKFVIDGGSVIAKDGEKILTGANGNLTIDEYVASQPEIFKVPSTGGRGNGSGANPGAEPTKTAAQKISDGLAG